MGRKHAMIADEIGPLGRYQRSEAAQECCRLQNQLGDTARTWPGAFELVAEAHIVS